MTDAAPIRILYVDDEPDIREVGKLALEAVGGNVVEVCSSGAEALYALPRFKPDLILLDVMMPGMDGPTTLRKLRELPESQGVPAVFMTAKVQPQEIDELKRCGAVGVIPKPFDPMTLAQTVLEIWSANRATGAAPGNTPPKDLSHDDAQAMAQFTLEYVQALPGKLADVVTLWQALAAGGAPPEVRKELYRKVHGLAGSAKTFGRPAVSVAARALELVLKPIAALAGPPKPEELARLPGLVDALVASANPSETT